MSLRAAIYGASGYTGQELIRILSGHSAVELVCVTSRRFAGQAVSSVFPALFDRTALIYENASPEEVAGRCDVVFLALPHGVSMNIAPIFVKAGKKVIDLSADYRLRDLATYEQWYASHQSHELVAQAAYGLSELNGDAIRKASLIANPGCYPTSIILGLAPALKNGLLDPSTIVINSASGVSGAGREPLIGSLFCEVAGGFKAYKVGKHRHTPEIEQELTVMAGKPVTVTFTPHLLPVKRGILSTITATTPKSLPPADWQGLYRSFYQDAPFVRVCPDGVLPNISSVAGSNYCDIGVVPDPRTGRVVILSAIDNLIKGAAGQAVQNMNMMSGFETQTGLQTLPVFP